MSATGIASILVLIGVGVILFVVRRQSQTPKLTQAQIDRVNEILDVVGKASVLRNVDPWGEVAGTHAKKLTEAFKRFSARAYRGGDRLASIGEAGIGLYLNGMETLNGTSALLHKLTLADAAYFREILQSEEGVSAEEYQSALQELAAIQGLEETIQQELSKTEASILAFNEALRLLDVRSDPTLVLTNRVIP